MACQRLCAERHASLIDAIKVTCGYLLCKSQEQGLVLHPLQIQVGVRVQDLEALEQLIIQPLNEPHQVTPYLRGMHLGSAIVHAQRVYRVIAAAATWLCAAAAYAVLCSHAEVNLPL